MQINKAELPEYLLCSGFSEKLDFQTCEFVLHTTYPYWIGQIHKFENREEMNEFITIGKLENYSRFMIHYNILCVCTGTLNHTMDRTKIPQNILEEMLNTYFIEKVSNNSDAEAYWNE